MLIMKYKNTPMEYLVTFERVSQNIVQIKGDFPIQTNGFILSRIGKKDAWDYSEFTTIYREIDGGVQYSNDGSVYTAHPELELELEIKQYIPTLEEIKAVKLQEVGKACEQMIYAGIDVELPSGKEHFSLTYKDQLNLFAKKNQITSGVEKLEYHQDESPCRYYTAEEMQQIIDTAFAFVSYHTTYCNSLNTWIRASKAVEEVEMISYGCTVPEEYQSEVLKDMYVAQQEA